MFGVSSPVPKKGIALRVDAFLAKLMTKQDGIKSKFNQTLVQICSCGPSWSRPPLHTQRFQMLDIFLSWQVPGPPLMNSAISAGNVIKVISTIHELRRPSSGNVVGKSTS